MLRVQSQDPPQEGLDHGDLPDSEGTRNRWMGEQVDEMVLMAACRDVLRGVFAQEGTNYEKDLAPMIEDEATSASL